MTGLSQGRVIIFGATGRLGGIVARRLRADGRHVLSVGRNRKKLAALSGETLVHDLVSDAVMHGAIAPGDIVLNLAHARFTQAIAGHCPDGIARLVVVGSTRYRTQYPDHAADEVRAAAAFLEGSALPFVLLHPTMIYGAAGENNVQRMAKLIGRFHVIPMPGGGRSPIQPVHVEDVARSVIAAITVPGIERRTIHLGGPRAIAYRDFLSVIAMASGTWGRVVPLPLSAVRMAARLCAFVPGAPSITPAEVQRLVEDKSVDIADMRDILGVEPRPLEQGLAETFRR